MGKIYIVFIVAAVIKDSTSCKPSGDDVSGTTSGPTKFKIETIEISKFKGSMVTWHATYRKAHGASEIKWSDGLAAVAKLHLDQLTKHQYLKRPGKQYGYNYFYAPPGAPHDITGEKTMKAWYKHGKDYNYNDPSKSWKHMQISHFTQLVWDETKEFGAAMIRREGEGGPNETGTHVVAFYYPRGNTPKTEEAYRRNVFRPQIEPKDALHPPKYKPISISNKWLTEYNGNILQHHNALRRRHRVNDLVLNGDMNKRAQSYVNQLESHQYFKYKPPKDFGYAYFYEYRSNEGLIGAEHVVQKLYDYGTEFKYDHARPSKTWKNDYVGYYTQMIWKKTKELGVGVFQRKEQDDVGTHVVLLYFPKGNTKDKKAYMENVVIADQPPEYDDKSSSGDTSSVVSGLTDEKEDLDSEKAKQAS